MSPANDNRAFWLRTLLRVAEPVVRTMAERRLKETMPVESVADRTAYTHLEALGRTLAGLAPWLEATGLEAKEAELQAIFAAWARQAIDAATDCDSPDYCCSMSAEPFTQSLVDAAFLAQAVVRAPEALWHRLEGKTQANLRAALEKTRLIRPPFTNWLLFSGMVEAALHVMGAPFDPVRVDYCIRQHEQWYKGDGVYGDGPDFHWDYYNSYVIQPMLIDIIRTVGPMYRENNYHYPDLYGRIMARARRYAAILERQISPEGTFPAIGRSLAYRTGAFQLLAQLALMEDLPAELSPAQVRSALQAVIDRCLVGTANFDAAGWLKIGLCGSQPGLGEPYISTGSLYLCTTAFLPLGLSPAAPFWRQPDEWWTSKRIWAGENMTPDHALESV